MATLNQSSKLKGQEDDQLLSQDSTPSTNASSSPSGIISSGTGGASTVPGSPGAQGAWTNIQAYMKANQGNTGTADALKQRAESTLGSEKQRLESTSQEARQKAESERQETAVGTDKASQLIQQAANNYNYSPGQMNQAYNDSVNQVRGALNATYDGPEHYDFALQNQAQQFGQLGDDQSYQGYLQRLYEDQAGEGLSSGQLALQRQLDSNNQALQQARMNALAQYSGLQNQVGDTLEDTNQFLGQARNDFTSQQNALREYLANQENALRTGVQDQYTQARNEYEQALQKERIQSLSDFVGRRLFGNNYSLDNQNIRNFMRPGQLPYMSNREKDAIDFAFDDNGLTIGQAENYLSNDNMGELYLREMLNLGGQRSIDTVKPGFGTVNKTYVMGHEADPLFDLYTDDARNLLTTRNESGNIDPVANANRVLDEYRNYIDDQRNQFYSTMDNRYQNTADMEKRKFNAIMDMLGRGDRMDQGFRVR